MSEEDESTFQARRTSPPAPFFHPRGYVDKDGHYAIWVGTPPGIEPGQTQQETVVTTTDLTPEQWLEGLNDDDFVEVLRPSADPEFETAVAVVTKRRNARHERLARP
jgi:hypothetical protein